MPRERGQLSLSLLEAGVGVLLLFGIVAGLVLGVPAPATERSQLDLYADDTATVLGTRADGVDLPAATRSAAAFERHRDTLRRRAERLLPEHVLYRVRTPHGAVGYPMPADANPGVARTTTAGGEVTVWVWYP